MKNVSKGRDIQTLGIRLGWEHTKIYFIDLLLGILIGPNGQISPYPVFWRKKGTSFILLLSPLEDSQ